jgi:uncharacterized membrane protein YhaH (DUF805 family)
MRMGLARIFSKQGPPIDRLTYALTSVFLVSSIQQFATSLTSPDRAYFVFSLICFLAFVLAWPLLTLRRLIDLRLNLFWMVPISVPLAVALLAIWIGWTSVVIPLSLAVALVVQLPLMLLPPHKNSAATQAESSDGSRP